MCVWLTMLTASGGGTEDAAADQREETGVAGQGGDTAVRVCSDDDNDD